jgi:hypothetical protein
VFPINMAALIALLLKGVGADVLILKILLTSVAILWSTISSISFTSVIVD